MIKQGSEVKWKWGSCTAKGKVEETYVKEITKTINGTKVTRKGESGNKALFIKQKDGTTVLKLEQEVEKI
ncbi:DUF2945 domain-containing protein [Mesonia aestuariivivens]|uniref:DUF2945 domain-containing protein n=1 Tax=Mesonia aestuariivivens TaxID=2796128 RepID=A0ABS6W2G1_9FLAO|nr:DUF2945 domain-containing protein [Mesonia aestuariivivens]MBW2961333.1 DUF2945 domain-containing protein [Mesonia aestuariivivens]